MQYLPNQYNSAMQTLLGANRALEGNRQRDVDQARIRLASARQSGNANDRIAAENIIAGRDGILNHLLGDTKVGDMLGINGPMGAKQFVINETSQTPTAPTVDPEQAVRSQVEKTHGKPLNDAQWKWYKQNRATKYSNMLDEVNNVDPQMSQGPIMLGGDMDDQYNKLFDHFYNKISNAKTVKDQMRQYGKYVTNAKNLDHYWGRKGIMSPEMFGIQTKKSSRGRSDDGDKYTYGRDKSRMATGRMPKWVMMGGPRAQAKWLAEKGVIASVDNFRPGMLSFTGNEHKPGPLDERRQLEVDIMKATPIISELESRDNITDGEKKVFEAKLKQINPNFGLDFNYQKLGKNKVTLTNSGISRWNTSAWSGDYDNSSTTAENKTQPKRAPKSNPYGVSY